MCYDKRVRALRPLNATERDMAMGYPAGVSDAFGVLHTSDQKRRSIMGAALNWHQMRAIMANMADDMAQGSVEQMQRNKHDLPMCATVRTATTAEDLQHYLSKLDHQQKVSWMQAKLKAQGFVRRHLELELKDPQMQPIQCKGRYNTQSNLTRSAEKWTADAIKKGWIEEIEYSEELFISPHFFKEKAGRVDADGDPLAPPLIDMSLLSAAVK